MCGHETYSAPVRTKTPFVGTIYVGNRGKFILGFCTASAVHYNSTRVPYNPPLGKWEGDKKSTNLRKRGETIPATIAAWFGGYIRMMIQFWCFELETDRHTPPGVVRDTGVMMRSHPCRRALELLLASTVARSTKITNHCPF